MSLYLYGLAMGLLVGGPSVLLSRAFELSAIDRGVAPTILWILGWTLWGLLLSALLPKPRFRVPRPKG